MIMYNLYYFLHVSCTREFFEFIEKKRHSKFLEYIIYPGARATSFRWFSQIVNLELDLGRALFLPLFAAGAADHVPRDDPCRTSPDLTYSRLCLCPLIQTKPRRG